MKRRGKRWVRVFASGWLALVRGWDVLGRRRRTSASSGGGRCSTRSVARLPPRRPRPWGRSTAIVAVLAVLVTLEAWAVAQSCAQLVAKYDGSNWWWGALGNCKRPGGPTDREAIFACAWDQVPASDKVQCLKDALRQTDQTRRGIDVVVAANTPPDRCGPLGAKYDGSNWWWGAFGNCKRAGGPTDRTAIFECAWSQVPAGDQVNCLKDRLRASDQTRRGIDDVATYNGAVANNRVTETPTAEACHEPGAAHVPRGYFVAPTAMTDAPIGPHQQTEWTPPGFDIGNNEGRLRDDLRAAAQKLDPMADLRLSAVRFATHNVDMGKAFADLAVTGRAAFAQFRANPPDVGPLLQSLHDPNSCSQSGCNAATQLCVAGCPARASITDSALRDGSAQALDRAYAVANILRVGNMVPSADGTAAPSVERRALGWIAVSGEDDQPYRPVNVPATKYPQFDTVVTVGAVSVPTRYMIAQALAPLATTHPLAGRRLPASPQPTLRGDAEVLLFIHGMDSRIEEAEDLADTLRTMAARTGKNYTVISVDLPTSGYAQNLDHCQIPRAGGASGTCNSLFELGDPKEPPQWFDAHGRHNVPVLDFIENFVVAFVNQLETKVPIKEHLQAVVGGSLGGNMSLRLGRRPDLPWLNNVVAWSPASIWDSLADGSTVFDAGPRKGAVRAGWQSAGGNPQYLTESPGRRVEFFRAAFDQSILGGIVSPAQAQMWFSDRWPCKQSVLVAARLDRQETYNKNFRLWHWRLGTEQLIYSHTSIDPRTNRPLITSPSKRLFLACGGDDNFSGTNICTATQIVAGWMTTTSGRALFLQNAGHSLDNEFPSYWAQKVVAFLSL